MVFDMMSQQVLNKIVLLSVGVCVKIWNGFCCFLFSFAIGIRVFVLHASFRLSIFVFFLFHFAFLLYIVICLTKFVLLNFKVFYPYFCGLNILFLVVMLQLKFSWLTMYSCMCVDQSLFMFPKKYGLSSCAWLPGCNIRFVAMRLLIHLNSICQSTNRKKYLLGIFCWKFR